MEPFLTVLSYHYKHRNGTKIKGCRIIFQEINYASGSLRGINFSTVLDSLFNNHKQKHQLKKRCGVVLGTTVWKILGTDEFVEN
jgi:hypothetical protein